MCGPKEEGNLRICTESISSEVEADGHELDTTQFSNPRWDNRLAISWMSRSAPPAVGFAMSL
jgi:hypothetical protein